MPLQSKIEKDFYMDYLLEKKINIEYWDVSSIYFKGVNFLDGISRDYVKKINSLEDLEVKLKNTDILNASFIININYQIIVLKLFRILSKYKCKLLFFARGILPSPYYGKRKIFPRIINNLCHYRLKLLPARIYNKIILILYKKLRLIKDFDVVFAAGDIAARLYKNKSEVVRVNYFDYDNYLTVVHNKRLIEDRYCVFLDDCYLSHPDLNMFKMKTINPDMYCQSLNSFFRNIEEKYGLSVVIASHPKANYTDSGVFDKRNIIGGKTPDLVKDCEFAVTHMSSSVSYAVLYKKPVIFIYTNEIQQFYGHTFFPLTMQFAKELSCNVYNIDAIRNKDEISFNAVDAEKYEAYKYNYLVSKESEGRLSKDIFMGYIQTH